MGKKTSSALLLQLAVLGLGATALNAHAQNYNQIGFEVEVVRNVANDELTATLTKSADHANAKTLANTLNSTANKALTLAQKYPNVQITTGRHHTYPRYDNKGKMNGFTGSASVNIKSQNFEEASELIAELQGFMSLENLDFGVSQSTQKAMEIELQKETIKKFSDEARTISHAFGANSYHIVKVDLSNHSGGVSISPMMGYAMDAAAESKVAAQIYEGGESRISYGARGVIELVK